MAERGRLVGEPLREMEQFGQKRAADTRFSRTIKEEFGKLGLPTPLCVQKCEYTVRHTLIERDLMGDIDSNL